MLPEDEQPQQGRESPTVNERAHPLVGRAFAFMDRVKTRFSQQPAKYQRFLDIMRVFTHGDPSRRNGRCRRGDHSYTRAQMKKLFKDHEDLFEEFQNFMPETYRRRRNDI